MRLRKILTAAALFAVAAAAVFLLVIFLRYLYTHDPASTPSPKCLFKLLTGYDCPGCGSQRAAFALLHGHVAEAWRLNPFIFFAVPAALFYLYVESMRRHRPRLHALAVHPAVITAVLLAIVLYWILRNVTLAWP